MLRFVRAADTGMGQEDVGSLGACSDLFGFTMVTTASVQLLPPSQARVFDSSQARVVFDEYIIARLHGGAGDLDKSAVANDSGASSPSAPPTLGGVCADAAHDLVCEASSLDGFTLLQSLDETLLAPCCGDDCDGWASTLAPAATQAAVVAGRVELLELFPGRRPAVDAAPLPTEAVLAEPQVRSAAREDEAACCGGDETVCADLKLRPRMRLAWLAASEVVALQCDYLEVFSRPANQAFLREARAACLWDHEELLSIIEPFIQKVEGEILLRRGLIDTVESKIVKKARVEINRAICRHWNACKEVRTKTAQLTRMTHVDVRGADRVWGKA